MKRLTTVVVSFCLLCRVGTAQGPVVVTERGPEVAGRGSEMVMGRGAGMMSGSAGVVGQDPVIGPKMEERNADVMGRGAEVMKRDAGVESGRGTGLVAVSRGSEVVMGRGAGMMMGRGAGMMSGSGGVERGQETGLAMKRGAGVAGDTVPHRIDWQKAMTYKQPFPYQRFFLPAAMIAYGATAVHNGTLQKVNGEVKEQVWEDNPHKPFHLDNYLMFAPTLSVYALNAAGIHGEHNFKDRTIILLMANIIANGTVFSVKGWSHERRPDGSDFASFPSGHTAEAFVGAEFMRLEYKDVSPWYGIAGYAMATATGMLRMYNDKHWMSDVLAGAGVGIASTRIAYWLYPRMQHLFGKSQRSDVVNVVMPTYDNGAFGLSYVKTF